MIFTGFVYLGAYIVQFFASVLPQSVGFSDSVVSAFATMAGYVQILDTLLPLSTLAIVLSVIISVDIAIFGFKTVKWLVSHLPFVGGRG